jgi:hypothetical protein
MKFIENNKNSIIIILILFILVNSCNNNNKISKMSQKIDSLNNKTVTLKQLNKIVVLEGLKNEKRMIQSTDRKILDLNREKEIDKEIKNIE